VASVIVRTVCPVAAFDSRRSLPTPGLASSLPSGLNTTLRNPLPSGSPTLIFRVAASQIVTAPVWVTPAMALPSGLYATDFMIDLLWSRGPTRRRSATRQR
jgi:hypothetical protein